MLTCGSEVMRVETRNWRLSFWPETVHSLLISYSIIAYSMEEGRDIQPRRRPYIRYHHSPSYFIKLHHPRGVLIFILLSKKLLVALLE